MAKGASRSLPLLLLLFGLCPGCGAQKHTSVASTSSGLPAVDVPPTVTPLAVSYVTTQIVVQVISGASTGAYLHYFTLMLSGRDILYSLLKAVVFVWIASTVQCYFGFYASGGPAGVGVAAGHGMRASVTVVIMVNMLLTMALWSVDAGARFGG